MHLAAVLCVPMQVSHWSGQRTHFRVSKLPKFPGLHFGTQEVPRKMGSSNILVLL